MSMASFNSFLYPVWIKDFNLLKKVSCPEHWLFVQPGIKKSATFNAEEIFILHSIIKYSLVQIREKSFILHRHVAQQGNLKHPFPAAADDNSHCVTTSTSPEADTVFLGCSFSRGKAASVYIRTIGQGRC